MVGEELVPSMTFLSQRRGVCVLNSQISGCTIGRETVMAVILPQQDTFQSVYQKVAMTHAALRLVEIQGTLDYEYDGRDDLLEAASDFLKREFEIGVASRKAIENRE